MKREASIIIKLFLYGWLIFFFALFWYNYGYDVAKDKYKSDSQVVKNHYRSSDMYFDFDVKDIVPIGDSAFVTLVFRKGERTYYIPNYHINLIDLMRLLK